MQQWLTALLESQTLSALVVYGSPYAWDALMSQLPANVPRIFSYGQMPLAQTIALETLWHLGLTQGDFETLANVVGNLETPTHAEEFTT
jgi:hypothetical protein